MDFYINGEKIPSDEIKVKNRLFWSLIADKDNRTKALDDGSLYNSAGNITTSYSSGISALIEVNSAYVYMLCGKWNSNVPVVYLDENQELISVTKPLIAEASAIYTDDSLTISPITIGENQEYTIPDGCKYLCLQSLSSDVFQVYYSEPTYVGIETYMHRYHSKLDGKTIAFFGDSIAHGEGSRFNGTYYGFAEAVNELAPESNCLNYCVGGAYWKDKSEESPNRIITQMEKALSDGIKPDYIVIEGGYNDGQSSSCVLSDDWATFDNTTMWGGIEEGINYCMTNWPDARILFATQQYVYAQDLGYMHTYIDGLTKLCNKWSIPLCDNIFSIGYSPKKEYELHGMGLHPGYWFYKRCFGPHIYAALMNL